MARYAVGRSSEGIEWNSPDGKLTNFIFLILTPQDDYDTQVQILGFIAKTMSDEKIRNAIMEAADAHDIWILLQEIFADKHIIKDKIKE